MLALE